ncbi:PDE7B (predicted) [Pycnogonum litorale]
MIPFTSCLRFNQRPERWRVVQTQSVAIGVQVDGLPGNNVSIEFSADNRVDECSKLTEPTENKSELPVADLMLIEALENDETRNRITGKFLTLQRRAKLTKAHSQSLSLPSHITVLLDNLTNRQTQCLLRKIDCWQFSAFTLDITTGGRSLPVLLLHLTDLYGLVDYFKLDPVKVWKCFSMIESEYHSNNPYHNAIHATDVTQAMHCFLQEPKILDHLTPLEKMSALIAAVTHDLDHPGVNQPFLVATSNHLASLYKNSSVLENHHWRSAVSCMLNSEVFSHLGSQDWSDLVYQIQSFILATDITRHQEFLTTFKKHIDEGTLDLRDYECRQFLLQIAMKCADISNPCRPWEISKKWSDKVCEEFFRQGDYERDLKLPVTSMCDRTKTPAAKIQTGFIKYVVNLLFELWSEYLDTSFSKMLVEHLKTNLSNWEEILRENQCSGSEIAKENSPLSEENDCSSSPNSEDDAISITMSKGRRYTLPLILPQYLPITRMRRETIPDVKYNAVDCLANQGEKQLLQHQPASFPPYTRSARQVTISTQLRSNTSCKAEAESESFVKSGSSDSSSECPNGLCPFHSASSSSSAAVQSSNVENDSNHDKCDNGYYHNCNGGNRQNRWSNVPDIPFKDIDKCQPCRPPESDENSNVTEYIVLPACTMTSPNSQNTSPIHKLLRRGSEPVDLKYLKQVEIIVSGLHGGLRGGNALNMPYLKPRRGSMPNPSMGLFCGQEVTIGSKPNVARRCSLPVHDGISREYRRCLGNQFIEHLAHISSSGSENDTSITTSLANNIDTRRSSDTTSDLSKTSNAVNGNCPNAFLNRRKSAPLLGHCHDTLSTLYASAISDDALSEKSNDSLSKSIDRNISVAEGNLWRLARRHSSLSLEYLHKTPSSYQHVTSRPVVKFDCQTSSGLELLTGIWCSRAFVEQTTDNRGPCRSESSVQLSLHSAYNEQQNSGIDVCVSQYLLTRGRRSSAPVTFSSSVVA